MSGTEKTDGQAAYEAWRGVIAAELGWSDGEIYAFSALNDTEREAWEAAAAAGAAPAHERAAELLGELNAVSAGREQELESANRAIGQLAGEASDLRALAAEILGCCEGGC